MESLTKDLMNSHTVLHHKIELRIMILGIEELIELNDVSSYFGTHY
jgi:hypothetical protein